MAVTINARNAEEAYHECLWKIKAHGNKERSRNGAVITIQEPVILSIYNPIERVLFNEARDANPFFHVMEFVWMLAGSAGAGWISQFNRRMQEYADKGSIHGAYGWRWRYAFNRDQIAITISKLQANPYDRKAVIAMWDADLDCETWANDHPCNTHIYFRIVNGKLNMTVCNRSNDLIWGMLGANVVHMTLLHELVALEVGAEIGVYTVMTNNLHIYEHHWHYLESIAAPRYYDYSTSPLLTGGESYDDLADDCSDFLHESTLPSYRTEWMANVAGPIYRAWQKRKMKEPYLSILEEIHAQDWRVACREWCERKDLALNKGAV
jgi:thymidylate synthase